MDKFKLFLTEAGAKNSVKQRDITHRKLLENINNTNNTGVDPIAIAGLNSRFSDLSEVLTDALIIKGRGIPKDKDTAAVNDEKTKQGMSFYGGLVEKNFFSDIRNLTNTTSRTETGSQLINKTLEVNNIHFNRTGKQDMVSFDIVNKAMKNLKAMSFTKNGSVVSYDLETMGNIITELSASVHDLAEGGKINNNISSVIGLDEKQVSMLSKRLDAIERKLPKDYTNDDNVFLRRLSIYGDSNLKFNVNGFEHTIKETSDEVETSIENARHGLEVLHNIYKEQVAASGDIGFEEYKKNYIQDFANLVYKGQTPDGKSIGRFVSLGQNNTVFDDFIVSKALGKTVEHKEGTNIDTFQITKYINDILGPNAHLPKGMIGNNEHGINSQDFLKDLFKIVDEHQNDAIAHTAQEDENALYKILFSELNDGTTYLDFLSKQLSKVSKKMEPVSGVLHKNDIFYVEQTGMMPYNSSKNSLNFSYNPIDKSYKTYDGYRINSNGEIDKEGFKGFGPKKGTLVTSEVYEMDVNSAEFNKILDNLSYDSTKIDALYEQYRNLDNVYIVKTTPYIDKEAVIKKFGSDSIQQMQPEYYSIFTDKSLIGTSLNARIGSIEDGKLVLNKPAVNAIKFNTMKEGADGTPILEPIKDIDKITEMLINRSMYRNNVDSAASTIRKTGYSRLYKYREYEKINHMSVSKKISDMVANNQVLFDDFASELMGTLGYYDYNNGTMKLLPESIMKAPIIDKYAEALAPFIDAFTKVAKEKGLRISGGNDVTNREAKTKLDYIYSVLINQYIGNKTNNNPKVINNYSEGIFSNKEIDVIDFDRAELFPEKFEKMSTDGINESSRYVTLDLNKNKGLMNMFIENGFKDNVDKTDPQVQFTALVDAYHVIKDDPRLQGAIDGISEDYVMSFQDGKNLVQLNNILTDKIKESIHSTRKDNPNAGYMFPRYIQDYSNPISLGNIDYSDAEEFIRNNFDKQIKNVEFISKTGSNDSLAKQLVDSYIMPFSKNDYMKQIAHFSESDRKLYMMQYGFAQENALKIAKDLIGGLKNTNLDLIINHDGNTPRLYLRNQDNNTKTQLDLFRFSAEDGILNFNIGKDSYAFYTSFDVNNIIDYRGKLRDGATARNLSVNSNLGNVTERMYGYSASVANARKAGRDIEEEILNRTKYMNRTLREISPRKERYGFNTTVYRSHFMDINPLIRILPELQDEGIIDEINRNYDITPKYIPEMDKLISKIRRNRPLGIYDLLSSEQNLINDEYLQPLLQEVNARFNLGSINGVRINDILDNINPDVQNTKLVEGIVSISTSNYATGAGKFDKSSRSVNIQQGNALVYNKKTMENDLAKQIENSEDSLVNKFLRTVTVGGNVTNKAAAHVLNNENKAAGLTYKYMQIETESLRNIFLRDRNENGKNNKFVQFFKNRYQGTIKNVEQAANYLYDRSMELSTFQQETLLNARLSYIGFHKDNSKIIDANKKIVIDHTNNLETIKSLKNVPKLDLQITEDGTIHYQLGYEAKLGDTLGIFGDNQKIISKFDGVFRGRYFNKQGEIVSEDVLNNLVKNEGLTDKNDIIKFLNNLFDYKYQEIHKFEQGRHKLFTGSSEKSTATVLDVGMGIIDNEVRDFLKNNGYKDLIGKVLSRNYFEDYFLPSLKLEHPDIDINAIKKMILNERFSFSDALLGFDELKNVGQISNLNDIKHESVSLALDNIIYNINKRKDKNDFYKLIFNDKHELKKNLLYLDDVDKIKYLFSPKELEKLTAKQRIFLDDVLNYTEFISNQGKIDKKKVGGSEDIAHTGYATTVHAYDDEAGSFAGNDPADAYDLSRAIDIERKRIEKLEGKLKKTAPEDAIGIYTYVDSLKEDIGILRKDINSKERQLNSLLIQKGMSFDERANLILQRQTYDYDTISLLKAQLSPSEFKKYFGDIMDEGGRIKDEYLGKPVLDPVTSVLRKNALLRKNELSLMDVKREKQYKYLYDEFEDVADKISVSKAETAYSFNQGKKAIQFNTAVRDNSRLVEEMKDNMINGGSPRNRYNYVDLSNLKPNEKGWLDLDNGKLGKTIVNAKNNPYTNNIIINTGLEDDAYKYLAVARMPEKHFEDGLIKKSHISILGQIQDTIKDINSGNFIGTELDEKKQRAKNLIDEFRSRQIYDVTSKNGLAGELYSSRIDNSAIGKASTLYFNMGEKNSTVEDLINLNGKNSVFNRGKINGQSFIEHYKQGKIFDIQEVSEDFYAKQGYFEEDFMKNFLKNDSKINVKKASKSDMKERMLEILETNGEAALTTRYPRIIDSSDSIVYTFLNRNLKPNEIRTLSFTQASKNGDNDGDITAISIIKDKNGNSYLLNKMHNEEGSFNKSINSDTMIRAVTDNTYWKTVVIDEIRKEQKVATNGNTLGAIANTKEFNGIIFSGNLYQSRLNEIKEKKLVDEYLPFIDIQNAENGGKEAALKAMRNVYKDSDKPMSQVIQEYTDVLAYMNIKNDYVAKTAQAAIGEVNVSNFKAKTMMQILLDSTREGANLDSRAMYKFMENAEQVVISAPKKSVDKIDAYRAKSWNEPMMNLIRHKGNDVENRNLMRKWAREYIPASKDDLNYFWNTSNEFRDLAAQKINGGKEIKSIDQFNDLIANEKNMKTMSNTMIDRFINTIDSLGSSGESDKINAALNALSIGTSSTGVSRALETRTEINGPITSMRNEIDSVINKAKELKTQETVTMNGNLRPKESYNYSDILKDKVHKEDLVAEKRSITETVFSDTKSFLKDVKGSKIALGALGIAAGVMMLGYAGAKPRPAETQAMEEADEYQENGSLADPGMTPMPVGNTQNGYVININARTSQGKDAAINAIQQAISNGTNASINLAMNINDMTGNMNDRDLIKTVKDLL